MPSEWTSVRISPGEDVVGQDVTAVCVLVTSSDSRYAQAATGSPRPTQASRSSKGRHTCASDWAVQRWSSLLAELEPETQAAALPCCSSACGLYNHPHVGLLAKEVLNSHPEICVLISPSPGRPAVGSAHSAHPAPGATHGPRGSTMWVQQDPGERGGLDCWRVNISIH